MFMTLKSVNALRIPNQSEQEDGSIVRAESVNSQGVKKSLIGSMMEAAKYIAKDKFGT